jgi:hypothetical protein
VWEDQTWNDNKDIIPAIKMRISFEKKIASKPEA